MRPVRSWTIFAALLLTSSCKDKALIDCAAANREIYDCINANPAFLNQAQLDLCIPYSEGLLLEGVWVTDFEWNQFHEDDGLSAPGEAPVNYKRYIDILPRLNGAALREIDSGGGAAVTRIRFEGRRPLCKPVLGSDDIIVDRVLSWEVLEVGPVNSITYGPDAEAQ